MIQTIEYKGLHYPHFQAEGFAAKFAFPFAKEVCKGNGYDIGCHRKEWAFPGAMPVDICMDNNEYSATYLPQGEVDYVFSSHCLEHIDDWVRVLDYWGKRLVDGGVMFLYLPHPDQEYWLPWHNMKHKHIFHPEDLKNYFESRGYKNVFVSGRDLNHSFILIAEK